ncbi:glycerophosphodiester phosphodiesterase family protein [Proteiniphilum saccharofermentans]|uniref:glycerophosphodiester phosphodiesterase family protein n=1 Tax=Proteiniphilum saccharofermentans TaxID=1642647 RepID=UPI0028A5F6A4|nr:glycerophosphodiester phosphodiesterase family protein [Proteiniphilum saccharofermentans]
MATIKINNNLFFVFSLLMVSLFSLYSCNNKDGEENYIKFKKLRDTHQYFAYKGDSSILVSGHRGGREAGYPENSIEGFQHVLSQMPAFFEVDPRLTKDSIIVLMHDATLDRTTDATGNLSGYTFSELQSVRLKDHEGNVTSAKIPTLEEVIKWSKGKTVVNLDKKDVPFHMIVELIKKHKAEKHVMLTVHTGAQARYYSDRLPGIMLSVFARNDEEFEDIAISGVPWESMIAYVGQTINDANRHIVEQLRAKGVRCMVSYAPSLDRLRTAEERESAYRQAIRISPDIIESDYPVEVWKVLKN